MTISRSESPRKRHCAVLAFPFGGHARPLLGLVCRLARASTMLDARFSFFSTARSNRLIFSQAENGLPDNITAYDVDDGVPSSRALTGNPHEPANLFLEAAPENIRKAMGLAVAETGVGISCLISDAFLSFSGELAEELHVPWILLWISMPYPLYVYTNIRLIQQVCSNSCAAIPDVDDERACNVIPDVPEVLVEDLPEGVLTPSDLESDLVGILGNLGALLPRASAIIMNFYHELDPTALTNNLRNTLPNLLYLGFLTLLLPPPPKPPSPPSDANISNHCISWLDRQEPRSVAYIGFGTLAILPENELHALAEALEESNVPYIWSLRDNLKEKLPSGFLQRIGARGVVVSWAPQIEVLAHSSTGVFITHCGSNSVYESVANGVPMICRPFFGDHRMNGRIVEEVWGTGVRVEGGAITKNGVLKSLQLILADRAGKVMREKVRALKELVQVAAGPDGRAAEDFRTLLKIVS
ncbi:hypothetical protein ACJRO7_036084 [Eucalyptus globulus]|uniref:Glycosyltransferase n=1 Tax=Eucalyptus globulus TaxID=34317 RepID=A0ABD3J814_EUCGL